MEGRMGILNIRNFPDDVQQRLRERAARNGRSMEAEARAILTTVIEGESARPLLLDELWRWVDETVERPLEPLVDTLLRERRAEARRERQEEDAWYSTHRPSSPSSSEKPVTKRSPKRSAKG